MTRALRAPTPLTAAGIRGLFAIDTLPHDDVLAAIGGHYGGVVDPSDPLDEAARSLFGVVGEPCDVQARRLVDLLFLQLGLAPDTLSADGLILPAVLVTRHADPLVISMMGHELARRAGLESHVCVAGDYSWTAFLDAENCTRSSALRHSRAAMRARAGSTSPARTRRRRSCSSAWRFAASPAGGSAALPRSPRRCSGSLDVPDCPGHPRRI